MWFWLVVAILAAIGEIVTYDLFMASLAAAAVLTAVVTLVGIPLAAQIIVFSALSLTGIGFLRPAIKHALGIDALAQAAVRIHPSHVIGKTALVTQTVSGSSGQVRIGQGEFWSARSYEPGVVIPEGESVQIVLVEGLTALVEPTTPRALGDDVLAAALEAQEKGNR